MFLASVLVIGLQTLNFAYVWFTQYNFRSVIGSTYWRRGHWALFALYALIVFIVSRLFGALKVGYMRMLDVIISQILSVICTNIIAYIQLALIGRWRFMDHVVPMVYLMLVNLAVVLLWAAAVRWMYVNIYPPRQMILVYDSRNPEKLLKNISSRADKYVISEPMNEIFW